MKTTRMLAREFKHFANNSEKENSQNKDHAKISESTVRGPMGPGSLTSVLVMRRGCLPQNINPISATLKSILVITRIRNISYKVIEFNQNILICTIVMSGLYALYPTQKAIVVSLCLITIFNNKAFLCLSLFFYSEG